MAATTSLHCEEPNITVIEIKPIQNGWVVCCKKQLAVWIAASQPASKFAY
jgi:hypothetical protein